MSAPAGLREKEKAERPWTETPRRGGGVCDGGRRRSGFRRAFYRIGEVGWHAGRHHLREKGKKMHGGRTEEEGETFPRNKMLIRKLNGAI